MNKDELQEKVRAILVEAVVEYNLESGEPDEIGDYVDRILTLFDVMNTNQSPQNFLQKGTTMSETVRVRIAVAVQSSGDWGAVGYGPRGADRDWDMIEDASDASDPPPNTIEAIYWITAELPIPTPTEFVGTVERDTGREHHER